MTSKTVDVNIVDKELIKRALSLTDIMTPLQPASPKEFEGKKTEGDLLKTVRTVAETLKDRGITLTVSFKGDRLVTIGAGANSTLLQFVTKTKAIAINNIVKLAQMIS